MFFCFFLFGGMLMFKKSIVIKQFLLYMATISFCVILMGGMLSVIYTTHYMSETKQELIEQGEKIAGAINKAYNTGNINNLAYEMQVLEDYMGAGVLLVNKEGVIVLASPGMDSSLLGHVLAYDELVKGIQEGNGFFLYFRHAHADCGLSPFRRAAFRHFHVPLHARD